jgi:hypothetical protein
MTEDRRQACGRKHMHSAINFYRKKDKPPPITTSNSEITCMLRIISNKNNCIYASERRFY